MTDERATAGGVTKASGVLARFADAATRAGLAYAAAMALFATPLLAMHAGFDLPRWIAFLLAMMVAAGVLGALLVARPAMAHWRTRARIARLRPKSSWFWYCMAAGLMLRLGWILVFPAAPASDGATYLLLARRIASGQSYETAGTLAYWPPGYPMWLAAWLALVGNERLAIAASNLVLFAIGLRGVWSAAGALSGIWAACLAAALFTVWPNYVAYAGSPEKEQILIAVLPWIVVLLIRAVSTPRPSLPWLLAGALAGAGALVQPSLLLLPVLVLAFALIASTSTKKAAAGAALFVGAMALVIAPWAVRNYQALGAFVPVASNGGGNLYRANNPLATGGYVERGEFDLSKLTEVQADRLGRQLALGWIAAHPMEFVRLALWKQVLFMGDDAAGVYTSVRLGKGSPSTAVYAALKITANAFWLAYWAALLLILVHLWRHRRRMPAAVLLPAWLFLYFFGLHSVFESGGKYHVALIGVLPVVLSAYAAHAVSRGRA